MHIKALLPLALAAFLAALPARAETPAPKLMTGPNAIWFENWIGLSDASLRVAAPDGTIQTIHEASRAPSYRLTGTRILDGTYQFELRAARDGAGAQGTDRPLYMAGVFRVARGAILPTDIVEE